MPKEDTQFKPGNNANPNGRPPMSPEVKLLRKLTKEKLIMLMDDMLELTVSDLEKISEQKSSTTVLKYAMASVILHAMQEGDSRRLEWILDKILGGKSKTTLTVETEGEDIDARAAEIETQLRQWRQRPTGIIPIESLRNEPEPTVERPVNELGEVPVVKTTTS